ncbi:MAG: hypothetical protein AAFY73_08910 [Pseudomonadota bacterium]
MSAAERSRYPVFVSYYTPGTHYEQLANGLRASLDRLGLDHHIAGLPTRGNWVANCAQKAEFVRDVWHQMDRPICWVDADAVLRRRPKLLRDFDADMGVVVRKGHRFFGGQVAFGRSEIAGHMVDRWAEYAVRYPTVWDQVTLGYVWWDQLVETGAEVEFWPGSIMTKGEKNPLYAALQKLFMPGAFFHAQESRRSRDSVDNRRVRPPDAPEFTSNDLPHWWAEAYHARAPFPLSAAQREELGLIEVKR